MICGEVCVAHDIACVQVQLVIVEIWRGLTDGLNGLPHVEVGVASATELMDGAGCGVMYKFPIRPLVQITHHPSPTGATDPTPRLCLTCVVAVRIVPS